MGQPQVESSILGQLLESNANIEASDDGSIGTLGSLSTISRRRRRNRSKGSITSESMETARRSLSKNQTRHRNRRRRKASMSESPSVSPPPRERINSSPKSAHREFKRLGRNSSKVSPDSRKDKDYRNSSPPGQLRRSSPPSSPWKERNSLSSLMASTKKLSISGKEGQQDSSFVGNSQTTGKKGRKNKPSKKIFDSNVKVLDSGQRVSFTESLAALFDDPNEDWELDDEDTNNADFRIIFPAQQQSL